VRRESETGDSCPLEKKITPRRWSKVQGGGRAIDQRGKGEEVMEEGRENLKKKRTKNKLKKTWQCIFSVYLRGQIVRGTQIRGIEGGQGERRPRVRGPRTWKIHAKGGGKDGGREKIRAQRTVIKKGEFEERKGAPYPGA